MERANGGLNLDGLNNKAKCDAIAPYLDANALAYILDQDNKMTYVENIKDVILNKLDTLLVQEDGVWDNLVPPANVLFTSIIALDTVYNDLSLEDAARCEA